MTMNPERTGGALGRGLNALIPQRATSSAASGSVSSSAPSLSPAASSVRAAGIPRTAAPRASSTTPKTARPHHACGPMASASGQVSSAATPNTTTLVAT